MPPYTTRQNEGAGVAGCSSAWLCSVIVAAVVCVIVGVRCGRSSNSCGELTTG